MTNWSTREICTLCDITSSKRIFAADYVQDGVPFYRGKEVTERFKGNLNVSTELFISEEKYAEIKGKFGVPESGDLLLTSVGTLGSVYVVKSTDRFYFKDGNLTWFRDFKELDSGFLYYWLISPQGKSQLKRATIGAAQPAFTIAHLKKMAIALPPLPTQRRIASILSAYDDLIENNTRRIEILEEMARSLYREWFVHFRFPGHEKVKLVDSELGKIPEGWEGKRLGDVAGVNKNTIKSNDAPDEIHYVDIASVSTDAINEYTHMHFAAAPGRARRRIAHGDVLWSTVRPNRCSYARVYAPPANPVASTGFAVLSPGALPTSYLYCSTTTAEFVSYLVGRARGATYPAVTGKDFEEAPVLLPDSRLLRAFDASASGFFALSGTLGLKNSILRQTRDLLLPKLISGEIHVDALNLPEAG